MFTRLLVRALSKISDAAATVVSLLVLLWLMPKCSQNREKSFPSAVIKMMNNMRINSLFMGNKVFEMLYIFFLSSIYMAIIKMENLFSMKCGSFIMWLESQNVEVLHKKTMQCLRMKSKLEGIHFVNQVSKMDGSSIHWYHWNQCFVTNSNAIHSLLCFISLPSSFACAKWMLFFSFFHHLQYIKELLHAIT